MTDKKLSRRQDTKLESEGAEFLVCGNLLIEGIATYKTYSQTAGYDLVAMDVDLGTAVKIQVKSRWATDGDGGFLIKNFSAEIVVLVLLNRGNRYSAKKIRTGDGKGSPEYYVLPVDIVRSAQNKKSSLGKVLSKNIPELKKYKDAWHIVKNALVEKSKLQN